MNRPVYKVSVCRERIWALIHNALHSVLYICTHTLQRWSESQEEIPCNLTDENYHSALFVEKITRLKRHMLCEESSSHRGISTSCLNRTPFNRMAANEQTYCTLFYR